MQTSLLNTYRAVRSTLGYSNPSSSSSREVILTSDQYDTIMKRKSTRKHASRKRARRSLGYQAGRSIYRVPKTEKKAFDLAQAAISFSTAGNFNVLNAPVVGAELYNRIGRKIYMKSVHIRGVVNNAATSVQDVARIILFYDSQVNGATPPLAALLQDSNPAAGTTGLSEINLVNRERFKIIRDYQLYLPAVTNTAGVLTNGSVVYDPIKHTFNIDWFVKLRGLEAVYNSANAGNSGDITSGALFLCFVSNNQSNTWSFSYTSRLRYYD